MLTRFIRTAALSTALVTGFAGAACSQSAASSTAPVDQVRALRTLVDTGHSAQALEQIATLRAAGTPPKGLDRVEGLARYAQAEYRLADTSFAAAIKQDPADTESAQMRGLVLLQLGRPADAIPLLEASRSTTAGKADPNYILALCYIDTKRYDDARHAFAAQYGFAPDSAPAYLISARMLLRREYLPVAQSFAERSLALDPSLPLAHELLGEIALAGNHLDEAIAAFEAEKARNPLEGIVYERLGDAYVRAARYDDARTALQQAVLLEPNATGPYILLGKTMLKKQDPLAAATFLEHANKMDGDNYIAHNLLGQAYRAMGRREEATRETEIAQKIQAANEPKLQSAH
jgi:tetratricopeptide (TPR) repeat protein